MRSTAGLRAAALALVAGLLLGAGLAAATSLPAAAACASNGARFEPPTGKRLLLVGQDRDANEAYVTGVGVVPGAFMAYDNVITPLLGTFLPSTLNGTTWQHAQANTTAHPYTGAQIGLYMVDQVDSVNAGLYDTNFQSLATWARNLGRPVFVRIGYEFDLPGNHYDPAKFVLAWRRIVDVMRGQNAWNVAFVWHSWAGATYNGYPISSWYPGDSYVDWVGVSVFGQPYTNAFAEADAVDAFADSHGKPLMIAESTPIGYDLATANATTVWNAWFAPTISWANAHTVKAWSYINVNWRTDSRFVSWGDSRIELNPALKTLWLNEITQASYLNASPTLFCDLAY